MISYPLRQVSFSVFVVLVASLGLLADESSNRPHDKAFWKQIAHNDYRVPAGESAAALTIELSDDLGSRDPELRDEIAYETSAAWIYRDQLLSGDELRPL